MTTKQRKVGFSPDIAIPPGETLQEFLDSLAMTQVDLAKRTGLTTKTINEIIKGKAPITQETALKLESVFGIIWRPTIRKSGHGCKQWGRLQHDQKIPWSGFQEMQRKFS
jgi:addiction module HigA family antidote